MGVDRTDYLMFGVKVDPDRVSERYEELEPMMDGAPGAAFDLVYDGMSGKYAVAGKIIAKSDEYDGLEFTEITDAMLPSDPDKLRADIAATFGEPADKLRLFLFSHYA